MSESKQKHNTSGTAASFDPPNTNPCLGNEDWAPNSTGQVRLVDFKSPRVDPVMHLGDEGDNE